MAQDKSILEDAIIQMKNLEEAVAENAKGILGSVMSKEIKELVKESLLEQEDEVADEDGDEMDMEDDEMDMEDDEMDMDDDEMDMDDDDMSEPDMESPETIDLTNASTSQVLKVFKLMGPEDEIVVTKDSSQNINLKDNGTGKEYMIMGESDEELDEMWEMEEGMDNEMFEGMDNEMFEEMDDINFEEEDTIYEIEMEEGDVDFEEEETIYEIEMDNEELDEEDFVTEGKKSFKAKGTGMGKADFKYGKTTDFKMPKQKQGTRGVGMGKGPTKDIYKSDSPSFDGEFDQKPTKKKESKEGMMSTPKKMETKEASRTYGMGSKSGRGLRKGITPNRNLTFESTDQKELEILREKNEEYRKALNVFRNKLNEVAVFNSNLAYATRLFTEHSTSKQEKINILQRFDGVETLKESKNLYKSIKDELSTTKSSQISESIERKIEKAPSTGSAINLIESKTYENPQFLRMKDLMSKLK
jgi:hypothetical protein